MLQDSSVIEMLAKKILNKEIDFEKASLLLFKNKVMINNRWYEVNVSTYGVEIETVNAWGQVKYLKKSIETLLNNIDDNVFILPYELQYPDEMYIRNNKLHYKTIYSPKYLIIEDNTYEVPKNLIKPLPVTVVCNIWYNKVSNEIIVVPTTLLNNNEKVFHYHAIEGADCAPTITEEYHERVMYKIASRIDAALSVINGNSISRRSELTHGLPDFSDLFEATKNYGTIISREEIAWIE